MYNCEVLIMFRFVLVQNTTTAKFEVCYDYSCA